MFESRYLKLSFLLDLNRPSIKITSEDITGRFKSSNTVSRIKTYVPRDRTCNAKHINTTSGTQTILSCV